MTALEAAVWAAAVILWATIIYVAYKAIKR